LALIPELQPLMKLMNLLLLKERREKLLLRRVWIQTRAEQQIQTEKLAGMIKIFKLSFLNVKIIL